MTSFVLRSLVILLATSTTVVGVELQLIEATKAQDTQAVRRLLLDQVRNVNEIQPDGATALHWAAHWNNLEITELLLQAGADVNAADQSGATPLWVAIYNGSPAMVDRLVRAGANPNVPLRMGETPLMTASEIGNLEIVKLLLSAKSDVNARESYKGQTALMWAVAENHVDVVSTLIEYGANVNDQSRGGFTPLLFASLNGSFESAQVLAAMDVEVNHVSNGMSPLLIAAASGHDVLTQYLLEQGANPKATDYRGFTALHYAAMKRSMLGSVRSLLARGADPNARITKTGSEHELLPIPQLPFLQSPTRIVEAGTRGGTFPIGATPVYLAAQQRNAPAMRLLAENGADLNIRTAESVYLMGQSGRRVNYIAKNTPLMAAAGMDLVRSNWNDYPAELENQALEAVKVAVELGSDLNATNDYGMTALHAAAYIGANTIVEFLIKSGANPDIIDHHGQTPLSISRHVVTAKLNNNFDIRPRRYRDGTASLLLQMGATPLERSGVEVLEELKGSTN